jgi:hypothetical protein
VGGEDWEAKEDKSALTTLQTARSREALAELKIIDFAADRQMLSE